MALADEISIRITGSASQLVTASKEGTDAIKSVGEAAKTAATDIGKIGPAADQAGQRVRMMQQYMADARAAAVQQGVGDSFGYDRIAKSAQESASVFQDLIEKERQLAGGAAEVEEAGAAMEHFALNSTRAKTELLVLAHEISQGNWRRFGGSLMVMGEAMGGIPVPAMAAAGAIAILGINALHAAEQAREATQALNALSTAMRLVGGGPTTFATLSSTLDEQIARARQYKEEIEKDVEGFSSTYRLGEGQGIMGTTSEGRGVKAATEVYSAISAIPGASDEARTSLRELSVELSKLLDVKGDDSASGPGKVAGELAKTAQSYDEMRKSLAAYQAGSVDTLKKIDAAEIAGDITTARKAWVEALENRLGDTGQVIQRPQTERFFKEGSNGDVYNATVADITSLGPARNEDDIQHYQQLSDVVKAAREQERDLAADETKSAADRAQAVDELWHKTAEAVKENPAAYKEALDQQLQADKAFGQAQQAQAIEDVTRKNAQIATTELNDRARLNAELTNLEEASGKLQGDRKAEIDQQAALVRAQLHNLDITESLAAEEEKIRAAKSGSKEQIDAANAYLAHVKETYKEDSHEYIAALQIRDEALKASESKKGKGSGAGGAALSDAKNDIRIDQEKLRQEEYELDAEVRAGRMTEQEKIEQLRQLTSAHYEEAIRRLSDEEAALARGSKAFQQAEQQKLLLKQQETTALAKLDDEAARAAEQAAQRSARAWEQATGPMVNAFSGAIMSMLRGQATFKDAMISALGDILSAEIQADIQWLAHHALYAALGLKEDEKSAQGGLLVQLLSQTGKTAATAAGTTTRTGLEVGSSSVVNGAVATNASVHAAGEMAKTGATAAGAATRTSIDVGAATAAKAADLSTMQGGIISHAASAAAATFDSVSQIPIIGYLLAPAAAAVAFAGAAAFGSLLSFDVGAWELPGDMVAKVHKGEMIVPANFSDGLRSVLSGGTSTSSTSPATSGGDTHNHFNFHGLAFDPTGIARVLARHTAANPSLSPAYK